MESGTRNVYPRRFCSENPVDYLNRYTPDESRWTQWLKCRIKNHKDENISSNVNRDNNDKTSFQNF